MSFISYLCLPTGPKEEEEFEYAGQTTLFTRTFTLLYSAAVQQGLFHDLFICPDSSKHCKKQRLNSL